MRVAGVFEGEFEGVDLGPVVERLDGVEAQLAVLSAQVAELVAGGAPGEEPEPVEMPVPYHGIRGQCSTGRTQERINSRLATLDAAGTNVYAYPNWYRGAYNESDLIPVSDYVTDGHDPLELVAAADTATAGEYYAEVHMDFGGGLEYTSELFVVRIRSRV